MKKRCWYLIKNQKTGKYLNDIDQTKRISWCDNVENSALFDVGDDLGRKLIDLTEKELKRQNIEYYIKGTFITDKKIGKN